MAEQLSSCYQEVGCTEGMHRSMTTERGIEKKNLSDTKTGWSSSRIVFQAKVFSTVDLRSGYWHCILELKSSLLTTFSTPFGRYRWCRLPFGLSFSSEIFQKRVNQALEVLSGVLDITDDILVYGVGKNEQEATVDHNRNLEALLQRCCERNIAVNRDKLQLKWKEVPFMGHVLTSHGVKMDPEKAKAVQEMPKPKDVKGL